MIDKEDGVTTQCETKRKPAVRLVASTFLAIFAAACVAKAAQLEKFVDPEGNIHFGTPSNPTQCCMCQQAVRFVSGPGNVTFSLRQGLERTVGNDRVYLSPDRDPWYCEGVREGGRLTEKCGFVPQMN